jgi:mRNA-degrading endonuclease RelE of RelBE toxin-antitoxin system
MSYSIKTIPSFDKQLKKLVKKYPSFKGEFLSFVKSLYDNPQQGTSLGNQCYKIRIAIQSKGKGKSGGARIISHIIIQEDTIYLISVYDKADFENITDFEIKKLIQEIG